METFRKVITRERKPPIETPVIGGWDSDVNASIVVQMEESGYWFLSNNAFGPSDCDEPDWWLEKI